MKKNVIFVCSGNSCRSQMAQGWARHLHGDLVRAFSAGTDPRPLDRRAVRVMAEAGVDISTQESHAVRDFATKDIDLAVIVCDAAAKNCPRFAESVKMIAKPFDDPKDLVARLEREEDILGVYRRVRDEIRGYIQGLPGLLE